MEAVFAHIGQHEHEDSLLHVVEHHHVIVERKGEVGQLAVVGRRIGQVFDVADRVVTGIADCPAHERRQFVEMDHADRLHLLAQHGERIGRLESLVRPVLGIGLGVVGRSALTARQGDRVAVCFEPQERLTGQETIAPYLFAADDTFKQTGGHTQVDLMERLHRGERVADQSPVNGHKIGIAGQIGKALKIGGMRRSGLRHRRFCLETRGSRNRTL